MAYLSTKYSFLLWILALVVGSYIRFDNEVPMQGRVGRLLQESTNMTCAEMIQEKYDCDEVGCADLAGMINYLYLLECTIPEENESWLKPIAYAVVILWDFILLDLLISTADHFFCPIIETIVNRFHMSPNFAGVTFLSLGIGAADLFTLISSFNHGSAGLAVGQNLGSDVFIVTIIVSCITLAARTIVNKATFLRDSIVFLIAITYLMVVILIDEVNIYMASGFLIFYCCYIIIVCLGALQWPKTMLAKIRDYFTRSREEAVTPLLELHNQDTVTISPMPNADPTSPTIRTPYNNPMDSIIPPSDIFGPAIASVVDVIEDDQDRESDHNLKEAVDNDFAPDMVTPWGLLKHEWGLFKEMKWISKINYVMMLPFSILRKATIPMVDRENWSKFWCLIASFGFIYMIALNLDLELTACLIPNFPNYALFLIISVIMVVLTSIFTKATQVPRGFYASFLMLLGFFTAANWTAKIADEIVCLFQALGYVTGISPIILGVTILSWGTGANDLVSDVTLAKQGYPEMSITACFAGPLFNIYVGMGTGMVTYIINNGMNLVIGQKNTLSYLAFASILLALILNIVVVSLNHFEYKRWFSFTLIGIYVIFMIFTLLNTFGLFF